MKFEIIIEIKFNGLLPIQKPIQIDKRVMEINFQFSSQC